MARVQSIISAFILTLMAAGGAAAQSSLGADVEGASDPSILGERFPDARIKQQKRIAYGAVKMWLRKAERNNPADLEPEGEVLSTVYAIPKERSALEVFRAYQRALEQAGAQVLYQCEGRDCGGGGGALDGGFRKRMKTLFIDRDSRRYGVFKRQDAVGETYVQVYVAKARHVVGPSKDQVSVLIDVLSTDAKEAELEPATAESIAEDVAASGSAALYGVYFELDSATLKESSRPVLNEIAEFLKARPEAAFLLVGHTDTQGELGYNLDLSLLRARAVVAEWTGRYGIDAERLNAHGVGYLAPVASNAVAAGRARNRRVELVAR